MRSEIPLDNSDGLTSSDLAASPVLGRSISIPLASGSAIAIISALVLAILLRLTGLDRWPLSAGEAGIALAARNLVEGIDRPTNLLGMPFVVEWSALFMFIGDTNGTLGRISMAFAGVLAVIGVIALARWIGTMPALAAGILLATSPTLVAASRRIDGGILLVTLSVALFGALLAARDRAGVGWPVIAGVSAGLLLLSGPLGLPSILLVALAFALFADPKSIPQAEKVLAAVISFAATVVLFSTVLLTRPDSFSASFSEMFSQLWNDHILTAADYWYMPAFNLVANEPLLLVLAIIAIAVHGSDHRIFPIALWSLVAFVVMSLLAGDGVDSYGVTVLPIAILGAYGACSMLLRFPRSEHSRWSAFGYVLLVILLGMSFLSLLGLVSNDSTRSTTDSLVRFVLVVGIIIVPLGFGLARIGRRLTGRQLYLVLTALVVLLSAVTLRSSVLAATERPGEPGDPMAAGVSGADFPMLVDQINKISRDLTGSQRDARDPTGGHGLRIAVDERIEQPFAWYFRDYPNLTTFDPGSEDVPEGAQIVIVDHTVDPASLMAGISGGEFVYAYTAPQLYESPYWGRIIGGAVSVDGLRSFGKFILNRTLSEPADPVNFQLLAIPSISERLFATSGPYDLDEQAGAGQADGQFNQPRGIAIVPDGTIYVVDAGNVRIQKFSPNGEFILAFGEEGEAPGSFARFPGGGAGGPGGIAIGSEDNVIVADTWNHRIQVFTPDGQFVTSWGAFFDTQDDPELSKTAPGSFYGPRGVAYHDGLIYVADTGNERIQVFTEDGQFVRMFGIIGSGPGELIEPVGIEISSDDVLLVADSHNARIARFTLDGEALDPWQVPQWQGQEFFEPYIAVGSDGKVFVSSSSTAEIIVFNADGELLGTIVNQNIRRPYAIAVSPDGAELLITDGITNAVVRVPSATS